MWPHGHRSVPNTARPQNQHSPAGVCRPPAGGSGGAVRAQV